MVTEQGPSSRAELEAALEELLRQAYVNGVDLCDTAYALRHDDPDVSDWEVHVTRTAKPDSPER